MLPLNNASCIIASVLKVTSFLVSHFPSHSISSSRGGSSWNTVKSTPCRMLAKAFLFIPHPHRLPMCLHLSHTKCQNRCFPVIILKSVLQTSDTNTVTEIQSTQFYTENCSQTFIIREPHLPFHTSFTLSTPSNKLTALKPVAERKLPCKIIATMRFCSTVK